MAISLKISGDNIPSGWDSELTSANPLIVAALIGDVPWYKVTSSAATKIIGRSPLGSPATTYFGFAFRKTGNPASSQVFLHPFTSAGATSFRLRLSSTGTIILDGASTNSLDTSAALANDTTYAIVGQITATVATVTIYAADGTTIIDTITATNTFGLVDNWRMGQIGTTPALPDWYFRMLLVGDTTITPAQVLATPPALGTKRRGVMGDSNTGENGAGPTHYFDAFTAAGINTRDLYWWGVGGKRIAAADLTGKTGVNNVTDANTWLGSIDTWLIALGTNDRPQTDTTINADIDTLLAAIGAGPKIVWIGLTSKATASADDIRVNNLIKAKLTARGNATFADWDAHIRAIDGGVNPSPYWLTTDTTHMTPLGYQERASFYAAQLADNTPVKVTAAGSLALTGSATRTVRLARTASGTFALNGTAQTVTRVARTAQGALTVTGTAQRVVRVTRTATASLELTGAASTSGATERTADGTLTLTGTATTAVRIARAAHGTLALGGIGSVTFHVIRTALGILTLTGQGVVQSEAPEWPDALTLTADIPTLTLEATVPQLTLEATW